MSYFVPLSLHPQKVGSSESAIYILIPKSWMLFTTTLWSHRWQFPCILIYKSGLLKRNKWLYCAFSGKVKILGKQNVYSNQYLHLMNTSLFVIALCKKLNNSLLSTTLKFLLGILMYVPHSLKQRFAWICPQSSWGINSIWHFFQLIALDWN